MDVGAEVVIITGTDRMAGKTGRQSDPGILVLRARIRSSAYCTPAADEAFPELQRGLDPSATEGFEAHTHQTHARSHP